MRHPLAVLRKLGHAGLIGACCVVLPLCPSWARASSGVTADELPSRMVAASGEDATGLSRDGNSAVLSSDRVRGRFRIEFELPRVAMRISPWVLHSGHGQLKQRSSRALDWRQASRHFFDGEGHAWQLPRHWSGPITVEATTASDPARTLRPQLPGEPLAEVRDRIDPVVSMALYAGLLVLAWVAFTALLGSRERIFLSLLGLIASAFLLVLVASGHAHVVPGLRWLASLDGRGVSMAMFLVYVAGVAVARACVVRSNRWPWLQWLSLAMIAACLLLAIACMVGIVPPPTLQKLVTAGWIATLGLMALAFIHAALSGVRPAWLSLLGVPLLGVLGALFELSVRGRVSAFWGSHGGLVGLVVAIGLLTGLSIGHIANFRVRHERERLRRQATELRLMWHSALAELAQELRQSLSHEAPPQHTEGQAIRIALKRLVVPLRLRSATVILYRASREDIHVVEPEAHTARIVARVQANAATLRALTRQETPMTALSLVTPPRRGNERFTSVWAGLPLDTGNFGSGVAVFERAGHDPFTDDELALAGSFARVVQQQLGEVRAAHRLRRTAELDALTGVLNRSAIDGLLAQSFEQSFLQQQALAVLFVDLDHFKTINDTYGHACGDHCLRRVAEMLRGTLRSGDHLGRYGGEEFLILLPGCSNPQAVMLGERLRRVVEQTPVLWQGQQVRLTISVGVSARWTYEDKPDAVERADQALYTAKREGRNRVSQSA